jgi:hypothetical protein
MRNNSPAASAARMAGHLARHAPASTAAIGDRSRRKPIKVATRKTTALTASLPHVPPMGRTAAPHVPPMGRTVKPHAPPMGRLVAPQTRRDCGNANRRRSAWEDWARVRAAIGLANGGPSGAGDASRTGACLLREGPIWAVPKPVSGGTSAAFGVL